MRTLIACAVLGILLPLAAGAQAASAGQAGSQEAIAAAPAVGKQRLVSMVVSFEAEKNRANFDRHFAATVTKVQQVIDAYTIPVSQTGGPIIDEITVEDVEGTPVEGGVAPDFRPDPSMQITLPADVAEQVRVKLLEMGLQVEVLKPASDHSSAGETTR